MTDRAILSVGQPCILCEEPLMASVLYRDEETGDERWEHEVIPHDCAPMRSLRQERSQTNYSQRKTENRT